MIKRKGKRVSNEPISCKCHTMVSKCLGSEHLLERH